MSKKILLVVWMLLMPLAVAEPYKYTITKLDANFDVVLGCGERQSMLSSRTGDYLFNELKETLNWTGRRTQNLLGGEPAERVTNAYVGNVLQDDMIMRSGRGHTRNISMPRGGLVNLAILRYDSPIWGGWNFIKYHNITIEGKSSFKWGYNIDIANTSFMFPLNNFSEPIQVTVGEQLNITMFGLDMDTDNVNCMAEDYFSRDVWAFYIDNSTIPSINSFGDLNTSHYIPSTVSGDANASLGVWYAELEVNGTRNNLTLSGAYPWEKNLSGVMDADNNGTFNYTLSIYDEYGNGKVIEGVREVRRNGDVVVDALSCPANVTVRDVFTCVGAVKNRGSDRVEGNLTLGIHSNWVAIASLPINLSAKEEQNVSFTIVNWSTEFLKNIGYHAPELRFDNASVEYAGNNILLKAWNTFRIFLSKFFMGGGLKDYVLTVELWNKSGVMWSNSTSNIVEDSVEISCPDDWNEVRFYYNKTRLTQDGKDETAVKFKKFNLTSGEYYVLNTSYSFVNKIGVNTTEKYAYANLSACSPITAEWGDIVVYAPPQSSLGSSGGGGGGGSYSPPTRELTVVVANGIDRDLAEPYLPLLWEYVVYHPSVYGSKEMNKLIFEARRVIMLGGPEALEGMGEVSRQFNPTVGIITKTTHGFVHNWWPWKREVLVFAGRNREETRDLFKAWVESGGL